MQQTLLADIGGTTTRLAVTGADGRPAHIFSIENDSVSGLDAAIRRYMQAFPVAPTMAVLALAAPVERREIVLTNRAWRIDLDALSAAFGFARVHAVNDFEALAWALPVFRADDLSVLGRAMPAGSGPKIVLGPGTGLGVAALVPSGDLWVAVASEGGHVSFGPASAEEEEVFARVRGTAPAISAEMLVSGPGLERLHRATAPGAAARSAGDIVAAARSGDAAALKTTALFVRLLGRFAGDAALMFKATGGVYLAGGVALKLGALLDSTVFRKAFEAHPPYQNLLAAIPTFVVTCREPGLVGSAAVAARLRAQDVP